jgi:hypothetical protein
MNEVPAMDRASTLFLRVAVALIGILVLALCIFGLPAIAREAADHYPAYTLYSVIIGMYITAIPFFAALYQAFRLLSYMDQNEAFSERSVNALRIIKSCAFIISLLYVAILPFFYLMAEDDDAPGIIVIGLVIVFASVVIAVFAAVLQKLLKNAVDIKSEHDLTV